MSSVHRDILFVTTSNLTTNPRLVKELNLAKSKGYTSDVVIFNLDNWSSDFESELRKQYDGVSFYSINAGRKPFSAWLFSSIFEKISRSLCSIKILNGWINAYSVSKRSLLIQLKLGKIKTSYDLIVGHNIGALFPALKFAKKVKAFCAFDMEDYHQGEIENEQFSINISALVKTTFPHLEYISFASPLFIEQLNKDFDISNINKLSILNCFKENEFKSPLVSNSDKLHLFWFSQNISEGRGIESIIDVLDSLSDKVTLHLLGNLTLSFEENVLKNKKFIKLHKSTSQTDLHEYMNQFDIGLSLEDATRDINRDLCISNKMVAYYQAGLFILATDTKGQRFFLDQFPDAGKIIDKNLLYQQLLELYNDKDQIRTEKKNRFNTAKKISWEKESVKLEDMWSKILNKKLN